MTTTTETLAALCRAGQELASIEDSDGVLARLTDLLKEVSGAPGGTVFLLDEDRRELHAEGPAGPPGQPGRLRFPMDQGLAGWVATHRQPLLVNDVPSDPRRAAGVDESPESPVQTLCSVPVLWHGRVHGVLQAVNKPGGFTKDDEAALLLLANQAAVALQNAHAVEQFHNFFVHALELLVAAIEARSRMPEGHAMQVARLATAIARDVGLGDEEYKTLYYAALIHDIGALQLFNRPPEEAERLLPSIGAEMVRPIARLEAAAPIIEAYCERYDGSGFPKGLAGEAIPLGGRILAVAEAFEVWRAHGHPPAQGQVETFITWHGGRHDPRVIEAFRRVAGGMGLAP